MVSAAGGRPYPDGQQEGDFRDPGRRLGCGWVGGLFSGGVETAAMLPGDMVVVPEKIISVSRTWQNTAQTAQVLSAVALAVEAARSF